MRSAPVSPNQREPLGCGLKSRPKPQSPASLQPGVAHRGNKLGPGKIVDEVCCGRDSEVRDRRASTSSHHSRDTGPAMPGGRSLNKNSGKLARQLKPTTLKGTTPHPSDVADRLAPHYDRSSTGVNHGPYPPRDLGGGLQNGGDGQWYGLTDSGNKIHTPGYCRLSVPSDGARTACGDGGNPRCFLAGLGPGTPVSPQQDDRLRSEPERQRPIS
ncbi:hypothetical protein NDU88_001425 [Pleurodeles waltl]|uniref:Uncharacterized protein n=1 Tax=Pleurodeles waltl TaxID=8319 RepID=A0AAV7WKU7_PLEWA|nr:hypothetical protein NDU88_001425 [Pleurodeles waltl]